MAKILLVEDDKSLREIYGVRLMAEGYEIVSAGDGEEALAMAIKERPDLIVSDVMMPKISGFDMLDILRSTSETKDVKVIMMTALSSDDQRARGEALGADRYLVKSQVGIEDVVRTVHDVLGDTIAAPAAPSFPPAGAANAVPAPEAPAPAAAPEAFAAQPAPQAPVEATTVSPFEQPAPAPAPAPAPSIEPLPAPTAPTLAESPAPAAPAMQPAFQPEIPAQPATQQPLQPAQPVFEPAAVPAPEAFAAQPAPAAPTFNAPATQTLNELPAMPAAPAAPANPAIPTVPVAPVAPEPAPTALPQPTAPFSSPAPASLGERVIEPLSAPVAETPGPVDIAAQIEQALSGAPAPVQPGAPAAPAPQDPQAPQMPPVPPIA